MMLVDAAVIWCDGCHDDGVKILNGIVCLHHVASPIFFFPLHYCRLTVTAVYGWIVVVCFYPF